GIALAGRSTTGRLVATGATPAEQRLATLDRAAAVLFGFPAQAGLELGWASIRIGRLRLRRITDRRDCFHIHRDGCQIVLRQELQAVLHRLRHPAGRLALAVCDT